MMMIMMMTTINHLEAIIYVINMLYISYEKSLKENNKYQIFLLLYILTIFE